jgi:L-serine deaminase
MQVQQLTENMKAVIIEVADIFYEMDVEEISENYPDKKEFEAHMKVINSVLEKAKAEGYTKYALLTHEEAKAKGQDLGINGMYVLIVKR